MKKIISYLEFGYQDGNKKIPYDIREYQEAYDFFMVSRYLKDIISYRTGNIKSIHHEEDVKDNLKKYTALTVCRNTSESLVFYEIGSSLMGVIDALEYLNNRYNELNIKDILYFGVDNSAMMNAVASYLHKDYKLALFKENVIIPCDLFFAKGVSLLYAFEEEQLFCDILKKSRIAIFDYTFSLRDSPIKDFIGSGKQVTYLNLNTCKKLLETSNKKLVLQPSDRKYKIPEDRALYECIYGDEEIVDTYIKEFNKKSILFINFHQSILKAEKSV